MAWDSDPSTLPPELDHQLQEDSPLTSQPQPPCRGGGQQVFIVQDGSSQAADTRLLVALLVTAAVCVFALLAGNNLGSASGGGWQRVVAPRAGARVGTSAQASWSRRLIGSDLVAKDGSMVSEAASGAGGQTSGAFAMLVGPNQTRCVGAEAFDPDPFLLNV